MFETVLEGLQGRWWLVGAVGVVALAKGARPVAKGAIKGYLAARDRLTRVTTSSREGLQHLYNEAASEYRGKAASAG